jgi:hypothetical protein
MAQRPAWMRFVAGILMIVQSQACASVWKSTQPLAPQDVVRGWKPPEVRVRLSSGKYVEVAKPRIVGDSLGGIVRARGHHEPVAFARNDVHTIRRVGSSLLVEVRDGDTIQIDHVRLTSDSVKGEKPIAASVKDSIIALRYVERLQVMKIPRIAERPRPSAAGFVVLRGEPVRVSYVTPEGKRTIEGRFDRIVGDTLFLLEHEATRIALGTISRLNVGDGTKSNALAGLIVGASLAALCGLGMATVAGAPERRATSFPDEPFYGPPVEPAPKGLVVFALGVLGAGALVISTTVGAVTHHDRWDAVPHEWLTGQAADSRLGRP